VTGAPAPAVLVMGGFIVLLLLWLVRHLSRRRRFPLVFEARVEHVCDGDSIIVRGCFGRVKLRIAGMDAPETAQARGTRALGGAQSRGALALAQASPHHPAAHSRLLLADRTRRQALLLGRRKIGGFCKHFRMQGVRCLFAAVQVICRRWFGLETGG